MANTPLFSFRLNPVLRARLQKIADAEGRPLSEIVDRGLVSWLDRIESQQSLARRSRRRKIATKAA